MSLQPIPQPKIALISLYVAENNGVRFLASSLRQAGFTAYEIYLKDYQHHNFALPTPQETELLLSLLKRLKVDIIGISLRAGAYLEYAASLTAFLKAQLKLPIIWGGMHVTMAPQECIAYTDLLSVGESEEVIVDVMRCLRAGQLPSQVPNIWLKGADGRIIRNPVRPLKANLDAIPFRDFHSHEFKYAIKDNRLLPGDPYTNQTVYLMMTARGCLFNCSYCDISALRKVYKGSDPFYRVMSPQKIVEECQYARQQFPRLKRFRFDDELFCLRPDWVKEFSRLYRERVGLPFELLTDPRVVTQEPLELLKQAGLSTVMMGIQHTNSANLRLYNRNCPNELVIRAAQIIHQLRLQPCYQILLDDPHVTSQEKQELFRLLTQLPRPYDLYLFSLSYWPQTDITESYLADGTITLDDIEGRNDKCLRQFHADLSWPRKPEDTFWTSIYTLLSKPIMPLSIIKWLASCHWLRHHPQPLRLLALWLNLAKLAWKAGQMLFKGELTLDTIKRWLNFKSMATS